MMTEQPVTPPDAFEVPWADGPEVASPPARQTGGYCMTLLTMAVGLFVAAATPALAHTGAAAHGLAGAAHGLAAGFAHPFSGADHVLAMAAVGLWAGLVGGRALWAWPLAFLSVMTLGAVFGLQGYGLPGVEAAIALSVLALGLAVGLRLPLPMTAGAAICGAFALFHGSAHGAELPAGAGITGYMLGFGAATALLHAIGIGFGTAISRTERIWLPPAAGAAVAAAGLVILLG
jgi:urease accessory protein